MHLNPNGYYNYKKHRKSTYLCEKEKCLKAITDIYHEYNGVPGHRMMQYFLAQQGIVLSKTTVHKYMNTLLGLKSIVRPKKPQYAGIHRDGVFTNILNQQFYADCKNSKWCMDFTYLFLKDRTVRYNCTIIDLFDRSVIASLNASEMTSQLAIDTLNHALNTHNCDATKLLLHTDQGSQFTSCDFMRFCKSKGITQSMSRAGYPYDNAPMERYFNTLKHECTNLFDFNDILSLDTVVSNFAYIYYSHVKPHSYNNGLTPFKARFLSVA